MNKRAVATLLGIGMLIVGCSKLKNDLPPTAGTLDVHKSGWTDSTSSNFHGKAIRAANWNMVQCRACHGPEYDGGTANVSCRTCHDQPGGPENCTTCHGSSSNPAPPRNLDGNSSRTARGVGAHQIHLNGGSISSGMPCSSCHNVPPSVYTAGHVDSPLPAEIVFNSYVANTVTNEPGTVDYDLLLPTFTPSPAFSYDSLTCGTTYCHGDFKNANDSTIVSWDDVSGTQAACGTCHGDVNKPTLAERALPKTALEGGTHPNVTQCSQCHYSSAAGDIINSSLQFVDKTKHVNGKLNVFGQERDF